MYDRISRAYELNSGISINGHDGVQLTACAFVLSKKYSGTLIHIEELQLLIQLFLTI